MKAFEVNPCVYPAPAPCSSGRTVAVRVLNRPEMPLERSQANTLETWDLIHHKFTV